MGLLGRLRGALALGDGRAAAADIEQALQAYENGRFDFAAAACERVRARDPHSPRALHLLGLIAATRGDHAQALAWIESAIGIDATVGLYHFSLGNALRELGRTDDAAASYARAAKLDPGRFAAWFNLAQLEAARGRHAEAITAFREALQLEPVSIPARIGLAAALVDTAQSGIETAVRSAEALALLERDWPRAADPPRARFLVAMALVGCGRWSEAVAHLESVVAVRSGVAPVHNALANCYNRLGRARDAVREYRAAFRAAPDFHDALTAVLGTLNAAPDAAPEELFAAHREWAATAAAPLYPTAPRYANGRVANRRLRIGYVSPDLRRHPVGSMFAPVIERHDRERFETFCYYGYRGADVTTARIRRAADHWREIAALDDATVAAAIRADGIDVLVDLAGHTRHGRPLVFARRPSPIQVSWLGYFNTTGLATMDYFLTDPVSSPSGQERYFVERLVRLPATRFCYEPAEFMPEVSALPAAANGWVTFGCLNALAKVNDRVLALWGRVLAALPGAKLLLQASALNDPLVRSDLRARAIAYGIGEECLDLRAFVPVEQAAYTYHEIDIALDPFPFCGGMTSLDALWMGVPVVTLPQVMIAGRQTASMLANLGLHDLVALDEDAYVRAAVRLAADLAALARLRSSLRDRFRASPLADYGRFTSDLERAYGAMWREWLAE